MLESHVFAKRRQRFMQAMAPNSIAIFAAAPVIFRNNDSAYDYRPNSDFYYLTGFHEPEALAVFIPDRQDGQYLLFNRVKDPTQEQWTGAYVGQAGAEADYGVDQALPITEVDNVLLPLLEGKQRIYFPVGRDDTLADQISGWLQQLQLQVRRGIVAPTEFVNSDTILHEMRLLKSAEELKQMRKAAAITVQAHKRAMLTVKPGQHEYQLQAEIEYVFQRSGSRSPAYTSIVGGGANACVLHYIDNNAQLKDGDLVLIDAGCEYDYYASDVTRTFPVNGKFSPEQKAIYEVVLKAQLAAIAAVKPGITHAQLQALAVEQICLGLLELGLLQGDLKQLIAEKSYKAFYMHLIGHWIGMDVHDVGSYYQHDGSRKLEPGIVLTVEPGIYINPGMKGIDEKWWGIGIRIEDDVLVTADGSEVLTETLPKTVAEIEALMATSAELVGDENC